MAEVQDIKEDMSADQVWAWHVRKRQTLPAIFAFVKRAALIHPSSAAAERVFYMLNGLFTDRQDLAREDYLSTALKLRYNDLSRAKLNKS